MSITDADLKEYYNLKKEASALKKKIEKLNGPIKQHLLTAGLSELTLGNYVAKVSGQDRSEIDQDALVGILKDLGFNDLIITKEVPDQVKVDEAVINGTIKPEQIEKCLIPNIIYTLKVTSL